MGLGSFPPAWTASVPSFPQRAWRAAPLASQPYQTEGACDTSFSTSRQSWIVCGRLRLQLTQSAAAAVRRSPAPVQADHASEAFYT